jgi:hypothetical protein
MRKQEFLFKMLHFSIESKTRIFTRCNERDKAKTDMISDELRDLGKTEWASYTKKW